MKNEKDFNPKDESRNSEVNYADLEIARGYLDFTGTPGHEFVGAVEAAVPHRG